MKNPHAAMCLAMFYVGATINLMWRGDWLYALLTAGAAFGFFLVVIHIYVSLNVLAENRQMQELWRDLQEASIAAEEASRAVLHENAVLRQALAQQEEQLLKARVIITGTRP